MPTRTAVGFIRRRSSCCLSPSCAEKGCILILPENHGEVACINGSFYQAHHKVVGKLCDCLVFWSPAGRDIFAPTELKGGRAKATECLMQLQNGAHLAQTLLGAAYQQIHFEPLLVHKRGINPIEYKILRNRRVTFRKKRRLVRVVKSGTQLASVVT